jgi:hypothetical protein
MRLLQTLFNQQTNTKGYTMKTQDDVINIKISKQALEVALELFKESMLPYHWHAKKTEVTEAIEQALENSK